MRRDYHNWYSHRVSRNMELLIFGEGGFPVLVFPTSRGKFFEFENNGMVQALASKIDAGHLRLFCVDSIDSESWYNKSIHPAQRVLRQMAYENYVLEEVAPLMKKLSNSAQIGVTGCSLGAYQAFNFAMKHPDLTNTCVCFSGAFDMRQFMDGYFDQNFYYNNPVDYLANISDRWFLDRYQKVRIVLGVGDHDICLGENFKMADILGKKSIPHTLDVWTGGEKHDWPLWRRMAVKFF